MPAGFSLHELLQAIWRGKWIVILVTLIAGGIGYSTAISHATYRSQGFFQFAGAVPVGADEKAHGQTDQGKDHRRVGEMDAREQNGVALADFKRFSATYSTPERFADFSRSRQLDSSPAANFIAAALATDNGLASMLEPVYPVTRSEMKELTEQPAEGSNRVIALRISAAASNPELARQVVALTGKYVMDSIVYSVYTDKLRSRLDQIKTTQVKLDSQILQSRRRLESYRRREADLQQIIAHAPTSPGVSREVVNVNEDNARYLPPAVLLTTVKVQISEEDARILDAQYQQKKNALLLDYFERSNALRDSTKSGELLLTSLDSVRDAVFKEKDMKDDFVREVYNGITVENQTARNVYLNQSGFVAGPTLPTQSSARPVYSAAVSMMVGLFLSLLLILGFKWWRDYKRQNGMPLS